MLLRITRKRCHSNRNAINVCNPTVQDNMPHRTASLTQAHTQSKLLNLFIFCVFHLKNKNRNERIVVATHIETSRQPGKRERRNGLVHSHETRISPYHFHTCLSFTSNFIFFVVRFCVVVFVAAAGRCFCRVRDAGRDSRNTLINLNSVSTCQLYVYSEALAKS